MTAFLQEHECALAMPVRCNIPVMLLDAARPLSLRFFDRLELPALLEEGRMQLLVWGCRFLCRDIVVY